MDGMRAAATVALWRKEGYRVAATNGCFDILHAGHVGSLECAKRQGDRLIVGINTDESVQKLKGPTRPINALYERVVVLCSLECVDLVVPVPETDMCQFLEITRPDTWIKFGYTLQTLNQAEVAMANKLHIKIETVPITDDVSTTRIIDNILAARSGAKPLPPPKFYS